MKTTQQLLIICVKIQIEPHRVCFCLLLLKLSVEFHTIMLYYKIVCDFINSNKFSLNSF